MTHICFRSCTCQLQAVLLLCPNIHLYSTDAMPANCSSPPASSMPKLRPSEPPAQRTCDCLTQTLCCHGCGNQCGYAIVTPVSLVLLFCCVIAHLSQCSKCSSTGTPSHNGANGHRFVFHQSEICSTERRYVQDEPDIVREHPDQSYPFFEGEPHLIRSNEGASPRHQLYSSRTSLTMFSGDNSNDEFDTPNSPGEEGDEEEYKVPSPSISPSSSRNLPEARPDPRQESFLSISTSTGSSDSIPQQISNSSPMIHSTPPRPARPHRSPDSLFSPTNAAALPIQSNRLCHGDVVWWHNLKRCGDIFGVSEEYVELLDSGTAEDRMKLLKKTLRALR